MSTPARCLVALVLLTGIALAQVPVGVDLPEGSALTLSETEIVFDLREVGFPPPEFPAYYGPTNVDEPLELRLFSNVENGWSLDVAFDGLFTEGDDLILPSQLEYSLDGGPWFRLAPATALLTGQGISQAYESHLLELRLRLEGTESPGEYRGTLTFTLAKP